MTNQTYPTILLISGFYRHRGDLYVTATTNGKHASGSYHYRGEAVDFGSGIQNTVPDRYSTMNKFAAWWWTQRSFLSELIHTSNLSPVGQPYGWYVNNGSSEPASFYGRTTANEHRDHLHVAIREQAVATRMLVRCTQIGLNKWLADNNQPLLLNDGVLGPKTQRDLTDFRVSQGLAASTGLGVTVGLVEAIRKYWGYPPLPGVWYHFN